MTLSSSCSFLHPDANISSAGRQKSGLTAKTLLRKYFMGHAPVPPRTARFRRARFGHHSFTTLTAHIFFKNPPNLFFFWGKPCYTLFESLEGFFIYSIQYDIDYCPSQHLNSLNHAICAATMTRVQFSQGSN